MSFKIVFQLILFLMLDFSGIAFSQQRIKDFYFSNYRGSGSKDLEVKGDEATIFDNYVEVKSLKAKYYPKKGSIDIKADRGRIYKQSMDTYLNDNVVVTSDDGIILLTDSLVWKKSNDIIETDDKVEIKKDDFKIEAEGMEADTKLEKVDFQKKVKVNLPRKNASKMITVNCEGPLEVDYTQGYAVFNKNVVVESQEGKMFSDKATVYFDKDKKVVKKIVSQGNVKIIRDDNITFAEKATYLDSEKKLILEGRPRLIIFPKNENTGD